MTLNLNGESEFYRIVYKILRNCLVKYSNTEDDTDSVHSISLEDLRITEKSACCCSSCGVSTRNVNPTLKRDQQWQLFKVNI